MTALEIFRAAEKAGFGVVDRIVEISNNCEVHEISVEYKKGIWAVWVYTNKNPNATFKWTYNEKTGKNNQVFQSWCSPESIIQSIMKA